MFKKAAQKHDLKFCISDHLWISPKWFSTSKGADKDGPYAGMHYDGANPEFASLYGDSQKVFSATCPGMRMAFLIPGKEHWSMRINDLIENYEPDLLYCDGARSLLKKSV